MSYLSDEQKTGIYVLLILCATALIMTWSIMGYRTALYHAQHPTNCESKNAKR